MPLPKVQFGSLAFTDASYPEIISYIQEALKEKKPLKVTGLTLKGYLLSLFSKKRKKYLQEFDMLIPEGVFLLKQIRRVYPQYRLFLKEGMDLITPFLKKYEEKSIRLMFLGGSESGIKKLKINLNNSFPDLHFIGPYSENFAHDNTKNILMMLNKGEVDLLYVGLGRGSDEKWVFDNLKDLDSKVVVCVADRIKAMAGDKKDIPYSYRVRDREFLYFLKRKPWKVFDVFLWLFLYINVAFFKIKLKKLNKKA